MTLWKHAWSRCRYIFTHGYDLSYGEAIRSIASPPVKQLLDDYSYKPLDAWPTPQDYAHMLGTGTCPPFETEAGTRLTNSLIAVAAGLLKLIATVPALWSQKPGGDCLSCTFVTLLLRAHR